MPSEVLRQVRRSRPALVGTSGRAVFVAELESTVYASASKHVAVIGRPGLDLRRDVASALERQAAATTNPDHRRFSID